MIHEHLNKVNRSRWINIIDHAFPDTPDGFCRGRNIGPVINSAAVDIFTQIVTEDVNSIEEITDELILLRSKTYVRDCGWNYTVEGLVARLNILRKDLLN